MTEPEIVKFNRVKCAAQEARSDHMQDWLRYLVMTQGPSHSVHWDDIATPDVPDCLKLPEGL